MHSIRLRDPWQVDLADGVVTYRRAFNQPTGLEASDVWLVINSLDPTASVSLNHSPLAPVPRGEGPGVRGEPSQDSAQTITHLLQPRNVLEISVPGDVVPAHRPFGEVRLEIEEAAR